VVTRQALEGLARQVAARRPQAAAPAAAGAGGGAGAAAAAAPATPAEAPAAPTQTEFAAGFVKGLAGELIPPERRPLAVGIALVVAVLVVVVLVRACGG
jgi:hypothetical protein